MKPTSTSDDVAWITLVVRAVRNGQVTMNVTASLPDTDLAREEYVAKVGINPWDGNGLDDFHNSWRTWGTLLECVVEDWCQSLSRPDI